MSEGERQRETERVRNGESSLREQSAREREGENTGVKREGGKGEGCSPTGSWCDDFLCGKGELGAVLFAKVGQQAHVSHCFSSLSLLLDSKHNNCPCSSCVCGPREDIHWT